MIFGFPISKAFNKNVAFKNVNELSNGQIKIYSFGELAPEILWEYGTQLPRLDYNGKIITPPEKEFGVLTSHNGNDNFKRIFDENFFITYKETFDLNYTAPPNVRDHKKRLTSNYYILKTKNE